MADRIALLDHGVLLACDTPRQLFLRPPTRRAARLMGISSFLQGELVGDKLHTGLGILAVTTEGVETGRATFAIRPEHIRICNRAGLNTLPAQLISQTFRGEHSEYQLRVGTMQLRVRTLGPAMLLEGGPVHIQLPPDQLFPIIDTDDEND